MDQRSIEERQETCATVSKIVKIKIMRRRIDGGPQQEGEIVGFDCSSSSPSCLSKCSFRFLMEDF